MRNSEDAVTPTVAAIGIAWYRREDYADLRHLFADGDRLPSTWDKWFYEAEKTLHALGRQGHHVERVYLDAIEFGQWCRERGLDLDAKARARFVSETVSRAPGPRADGFEA